MLSFTYDEDTKAIVDHHYQIIHGPYGFGRVLLQLILTNSKRNQDRDNNPLYFKTCCHEYGTNPLVTHYKVNQEYNFATLGSIIYYFGGFANMTKVTCSNTSDPGRVWINEVPATVKYQFHLHDTKTLLAFHHGQDHLHVSDIATNSCYVYDDKFEYEDYPIIHKVSQYYYYGTLEIDRKDYPVNSKVMTIDKTWHCNDGIVAYDPDGKKWF
ncbi:hypothetical protein EPI10_018890 [Gossypium australe]|uniref:Uncharacterized protein n=1 Tax=Gossypium australe TaxID=47621 RepID=A0A5B6UDL9_9ROSI|nr:hypothetical protein EPI10_018890 [Gossypium australe]